MDDYKVRSVGFVGLGKIGLPICKHLIDGGFRVLGYRRGSMDEFRHIGGIAAESPAQIGVEADIVFSCLPSDDALNVVMYGECGLISAVRKDQIIVELGSHAVSVKQAFVAPVEEKGGFFIDGEVSGTPGMVAAKKAAIYLSGDQVASKRLFSIVETFAETCFFLGPFGSSTKVKLVNNWLVAANIASTAQAMAIGVRIGVDVDLMIRAISKGSGGSTQFGIRAPWMAQRKYLPQQGSARSLIEYLIGARELAIESGASTRLLDHVMSIFVEALPSIKDQDVAAIFEEFEDVSKKLTS